MTISLFAGFPAPRRRAGLLAASLALLMAAAGPLHAQDAKDPVVAKVNGTEIHQSDLAVAEQEAGRLPPMSDAAKKDYLVQFMADVILVAKAAEDKAIDRDRRVQAKLAFERKKLLMTDLMESVAKDAVTDAALHKVYDDAIKQMGKQEEVHARHILIRAKPGDEKASEAAKTKIEAIIAKLKNGEDFAKLAKEDTEDPSGKANGGDLGYFTKDQMVPRVLQGGVRAEEGRNLRAGEDPVRLARHQGRGQAHQAAAEVRGRSRTSSSTSSSARRRPSWCRSCAPRPRSRRSTRPRTRRSRTPPSRTTRSPRLRRRNKSDRRPFDNVVMPGLVPGISLM